MLKRRPTSTQRWRRRGAPSVVLLLAVILVVVGGLVGIQPRTVTNLGSSGSHPAIQLTSSSPGTIAPYQSGELWGGGSPSETCTTCTVQGLLGSAGGQSIQANAPVDPATGDYSTSDELFSLPAIGGDMGVTLNYDEQRGDTFTSTPGFFGYGWSSTFAPTLVNSSGTVTVNEGTGSQVTFSPPGAFDGCPSSDYQDVQKYTVPSSNDLFCAPRRVDAQMGEFSAYGSYELAMQGGKESHDFNAYGLQVGLGNVSNAQLITYSYDVAPGTNGCPTSAYTCTIEQDQAGRKVIGEQSSTGTYLTMLDPAGRAYNLAYGGNGGDLTTVTKVNYGNAAYHYAYTNGAPYVNAITAVTDPVGNTTNIAYTAGMVTTITAPDGSQTGYSYANGSCATLAGCTETTGGSPLAQQATIKYPDHEDDIDTYEGGQIGFAQFGPDTTVKGSADDYYTYSVALENNADQDSLLVETVTHGGDNDQAIFEMDSEGNVLAYADPNGHTTFSMYNDTGGHNLDELCWTAAPGVTVPSNASCTNPPPGSTSYTYDADGNQLSETDPLGNTTHSGYYTNDLLCWTAQPTVGNGSPCTNTGSTPNGAPTGATTYAYDGQGDVTAQTVATGTAAAQVTSTSYDSLDRPSYKIPPNGQGQGSFGSNPYETSYSFTGNDQLYLTLSPTSAGSLGSNAAITTNVYDLDGQLTDVIDPAGATSTAYDGDGRVCWTYRGPTGSAVTNPSCGSTPPTASTISSYYPGYPKPSLVKNPDGNTTTYYFADYRFPDKPTETVDPMNIAVEWDAYSPYGDTCVDGPVQTTVASCSVVSGDTTDAYNMEGQLNQETDPLGNVTTYTYADAAFPMDATQVANPLGKDTNNNYDADGHLTWSEDPEGNYSATAYDTDGRPCFAFTTTTQQTANSVTSALCSSPPSGTGDSLYEYNAANQLYAEGDNWGTSSEVTTVDAYYAGGQLNSTSDDNGRTVSYQYNDAGAVSCIAYPVLSSPNCSNAPSTTNSVVDRTYDGDNRLASTVDWLGNTVKYSNYDTYSNLGTITYPSATGESVSYGYDAAEHLTSATYAGSMDSWTPNADGLVGTSSSTLPSMVSSTDTYNSYDQLTQASNVGNTNPDAYGVQPNGEITADTVSGSLGISETYNDGSELLTRHNSVGNTTTAYGYTADGQRCWQGSTSASGACTSPPSGATSYGWNGFGQLCWSGATTNTSASCASAPTGTTTYTYDGQGRRMTEAIPGQTTLAFTWDSLTSADPQLIDDGVSAYIFGPTVFGENPPVEEINLSSKKVTFVASTPSGTQTFFDHAGSSNNLDAEVGYNAYGTASYLSGNNTSSLFNTPNFLYDGGYHDTSGLMFFINRYYDPTTDQFLSVDPDVATTGQPYAFTGDDPLNATDPLGLTASPRPTPKALCASSRQRSKCVAVATKRDRCGRLGCPTAKAAHSAWREAVGLVVVVGTGGLALGAVGSAESGSVLAEAAPTVAKTVALGATAHYYEGYLNGVAANPNTPTPTRDLASSESRLLEVGDPAFAAKEWSEFLGG